MAHRLTKLDFPQGYKPTIFDSISLSELSKATELSERTIAESWTKRMQVVKEKLAEKGLLHLLSSPPGRFQRLVREVRPNGKEEWWADNGTSNGVLLVTFNFDLNHNNSEKLDQ